MQALLQELHQWQHLHQAAIAQFPVDSLKELDERLRYPEQAHYQSKAFERVSAETSGKLANNNTIKPKYLPTIIWGTVN